MSWLQGTGASHGIAGGSALVIGRWELNVSHYRVAPGEVRRELRRFWRARQRAKEEIREIRDKTVEQIGEKYGAIFDAHLLILDDRKLGRETMELIRERRINAEWALAKTVQGLLRAFERVDDPYLRERGGDVADVHQRLQRILSAEENHQEGVLDLDRDTVVIAHNLLPSDAVWLHQPRVVAFVTEEGGKTSHTAILANALEIPAIVGVDDATITIEQGDEVIVDGGRGRVVIRPTPAERELLHAERRRQERLEETLLSHERGPVRTADGAELTIQANVEFPEEMRTLRRIGAQGVGLYRSEFLFLSTAPRLPDEEEHLEAYRSIAGAAGGEPVVIRTLDLGGEKYFHQVLDAREANPVMGLRAVRFCLHRPDIFRVQLRGLLRAAAEFGNISILVPMISGVAEWIQAREFIRDVRRELRGEGLEIPEVPLGPMIEIPSAALVADELARASDFLSLGTNDLQQYTLAVDRSNRSVAYLNDPWHPALLRLIRETVLAGRRHGKPVNLCGEMASDPVGALTLLGLGLTRFSCNPVTLSEVRQILSRASQSAAERVMQQASGLATGQEIRAHVEAAFGGLVEAVLGPSLEEDPASTEG